MKKRGTVTIFAQEVLVYPSQQISSAHAFRMGVSLITLTVIENYQFSCARIKANALYFQ